MKPFAIAFPGVLGAEAARLLNQLVPFAHRELIERAMTEIELQFPIEDGSKKSAVQAAREEKEEQAEQEHVEAEAAALGEMPTTRIPHLRRLRNV